ALDETQAAARKTHGLRDLLRDVDVGRIQENVVGNQKLARADDGGSGRGMDARLAEIGLARGVGRNVGTDAFELTAANVLQVLTLGRGCGGFIEIDGDLKAFCDLGSYVAGHGYAVFDSDAVDWYEGHYVGCAHTRVRTLMFGEIDQLGGLPHAANGSFLNGIALAYQGNDATVVVGIHLAVEEIDAGNLHGFDNGVNFGRVAAFGKIRNAFHQSAGHGKKDNGPRLVRQLRTRESQASCRCIMRTYAAPSDFTAQANHWRVRFRRRRPHRAARARRPHPGRHLSLLWRYRATSLRIEVSRYRSALRGRGGALFAGSGSGVAGDRLQHRDRAGAP